MPHFIADQEGSTGSPMRVLFAEQDVIYRDALARYLVSNGLNVSVFSDPAELRGAMAGNCPVLVLMPLRARGQDSMSLLWDKLATSRHACVILAGGQEEAHRVRCLESGADDFILKTTQQREILARLRVVLRRSARQAPALPAAPDAGWRLVPAERRLLRPDATEVGLTTAEFNLLETLVANRGRTLSREELFAQVLRRPFFPLDRAIDNLVAKLRAKLSSGPGAGGTGRGMIRTVRPIGYTFTGFPPAER